MLLTKVIFKSFGDQVNKEKDPEARDKQKRKIQTWELIVISLYLISIVFSLFVSERLFGAQLRVKIQEAFCKSYPIGSSGKYTNCNTFLNR